MEIKRYNIWISHRRYLPNYFNDYSGHFHCFLSRKIMVCSMQSTSWRSDRSRGWAPFFIGSVFYGFKRSNISYARHSTYHVRTHVVDRDTHKAFLGVKKTARLRSGRRIYHLRHLTNVHIGTNTKNKLSRYRICIVLCWPMKG